MTNLIPDADLEATRDLKKALIAEYGSFADRRIKNVDKGSLFTVDDRHAGGIAANGSFYGWFCAIGAAVIDNRRVRITITNDIPHSPGMRAWEQKHGVARQGVSIRDNRLQFDVTPEDAGKLLTLAQELRAIVAPGARYPVPSYKYACPRAATALNRLHGVLAQHWSK